MKISREIHSDVGQKSPCTAAVVRIEDAEYERRFNLTCEQRITNIHIRTIYVPMVSRSEYDIYRPSRGLS